MSNENRKANRTRNNTVTFRMNDAEYADFQHKVNASGLTQQSYIINSIRRAVIPSADEISVLRKMGNTLENYERQLRGMATNINQMAHVANGHGFIPEEAELENIADQITGFRKENNELWLSIKSSINPQKAMGQ